MPFLAVELLSPGTEAEDLGQTIREVEQPPTKWQVYEQILRIPYYGMYDRYANQFRLFQLVGVRYQEMPLAEQRFWFEELGLGLGVWSGRYQMAEGQWLRWYDAEGQWLPTPAEQGEQERQQAEQERQRAEQERQRAEQAEGQLVQAEGQLVQAARSLLAQGMPAAQVTQLLSLSVAQVEQLYRWQIECLRVLLGLFRRIEQHLGLPHAPRPEARSRLSPEDVLAQILGEGRLHGGTVPI